jgi:hypothetical protein
MLYREIIAVCAEIHTKHINTLCGQNVEFLSIKPVGRIFKKWGGAEALTGLSWLRIGIGRGGFCKCGNEPWVP